MKYSEMESAFSVPRLGRYLRACDNDKQKALVLYRHNVKLGQRFYGVLGVLEVILRTAINEHFKVRLSDSDWIMAQSVEGFLRRYKDSISKEYSKLVRDGNYTNDKVLSSLSFGIWVFLFSRGCYKESGKTLLRIFPNKPHGLNQADIYRGLDTIRLFRNRMAHHEPLCFDRAGEIDVSRAEEVYELVCDYIHYLGFNPRDVLYGIEKPEKVMACIGELMKR